MLGVLRDDPKSQLLNQGTLIQGKAMVPYVQLSINCGLDNYITEKKIIFIVLKAYSAVG